MVLVFSEKEQDCNNISLKCEKVVLASVVEYICEYTNFWIVGLIHENKTTPTISAQMIDGLC